VFQKHWFLSVRSITTSSRAELSLFTVSGDTSNLLFSKSELPNFEFINTGHADLLLRKLYAYLVARDNYFRILEAFGSHGNRDKLFFFKSHCPTIAEEIRCFSSHYGARLRTHPNHLGTNLLGESVSIRLRRHLANDLPD
jgi:hypothetical protein